jgi:DNA-binding XRE family transcriptional regulator
MTTHFVEGVTLKTIHCCNCAMVFAMDGDFYDRRLKDRGTWYCPAGHPQHFTGETEAQRLQRELEHKQRQLEMEEAHSARLKTERDQVARAHHRMRQRVFNGVCPCCNRTFQNLMAHMKTEHAAELSLANVRQAFGMTQTQVAEEVGVYAAQVSLYERGKPVPAWVSTRIEGWLERQTKRAAKLAKEQPETP